MKALTLTLFVLCLACAAASYVDPFATTRHDYTEGVVCYHAEEVTDGDTVTHVVFEAALLGHDCGPGSAIITSPAGSDAAKTSLLLAPDDKIIVQGELEREVMDLDEHLRISATNVERR